MPSEQVLGAHLPEVEPQAPLSAVAQPNAAVLAVGAREAGAATAVYVCFVAGEQPIGACGRQADVVAAEAAAAVAGEEAAGAVLAREAERASAVDVGLVGRAAAVGA